MRIKQEVFATKKVHSIETIIVSWEQTRVIQLSKIEKENHST